MAVNVWYIKLYGLDENYINKFSNIPERIQICNFGSSYGLYGYNYEDYVEEYNCFNFGLSGQSLSYDYRLFKNYESHIDEGTVVFITVSYFSLFGQDETKVDNFAEKNVRYYSILPPSLIKEYDVKTDLKTKFPCLFTNTGNLIKTLLGKNRVDTTDEVWERIATDIDVYADAKSKIEKQYYNGEVNQEALESLYNLIQDSKNKGAIPILITTPFLHEYTDELMNVGDVYDSYYSIINQVMLQTEVEYYDYGSDQRFSEKYEWFIDSTHLNKEGAKAFLGILMDEIVTEKGYYQ